MSAATTPDLPELLALPLGRRIEPLVAYATALAESLDAGESLPPGAREAAVDAILDIIRACAGSGRSRMRLGEALGRLGDPRLRSADAEDYWTLVGASEGKLLVGRFPVTTQEFQTFVRSGAYEADRHWSEGGLAWRNSGARAWSELAAWPVNAPLVMVNQPVVGVTWWEAEAFANAHGARLPTFGERLEIVRGLEKRPYPWGEPFGQGNANTAEEVLSKPCAVGLYISDCTPEGVWDLAGNAAEWTADEVNGQRVVAPGSYRQPSMASWAKARELVEPNARLPDLGFRLVREP